MRKTSIGFSNAVDNINKLTHDERAELITEVMNYNSISLIIRILYVYLHRFNMLLK